MLLVLWSGRQIYLSPPTEDNLKRPGTRDFIPNTSANKIICGTDDCYTSNIYPYSQIVAISANYQIIVSSIRKTNHWIMWSAAPPSAWNIFRVRSKMNLHFQGLGRKHGKAWGGRIAGCLTNEQRSHAGWIGASKCEVIFERSLKTIICWIHWCARQDSNLRPTDS